MTRHPRIPAIVALLVTAGAGLGILAATGQFRTTDQSHATLEELEMKIIGSQDGQLWLAYGDKLMAAGQPYVAAKAYERAVLYQGDLADARVNLGLALGQVNDPDAFFDYVGRLCINYPKLADDLMRRPELAPLQGHERWEPTQTTARAQAVD